MENIVLIVLLVSLFVSTTSIAIAFIITVTVLYVFFADIPLMMIASGLFYKLDSFPLEAVLFFVLLGNIMRQGDSSRYLIEFTRTMVSRIPGGLGIAGVIACAIFGAISGSATATVVAIAPMLIPQMLDAGYDKGFSIGALSTAGILGVIIPPSILMILYSVVANVSMGKLFLGGFLPGALIVIALSLYVMITAKRRGYGIIEDHRNQVVGSMLYLRRRARPSGHLSCLLSSLGEYILHFARTEIIS